MFSQTQFAEISFGNALEQISRRYRVFAVEGRRSDPYQPGPKAQVAVEKEFEAEGPIHSRAFTPSFNLF
jgi:hypothetical protein